MSGPGAAHGKAPALWDLQPGGKSQSSPGTKRCPSTRVPGVTWTSAPATWAWEPPQSRLSEEEAQVPRGEADV